MNADDSEESSYVPPQPTMVQLPPGRTLTQQPSSHASVVLPEGMDAEVFGALPPEIQQEIIAQLHQATPAPAPVVAMAAAPSVSLFGEDDYTGFDDQTALALETDTREPWSCPACTFVNHPDLLECEICETMQPTSEQLASRRTSRSSRSGALGLSSAMARLILKKSGSTTSNAVDGGTAVEPIDELLNRVQSNANQRLTRAKKKMAELKLAIPFRKNSALPTAVPTKQACLELGVLQEELKCRCVAGEPLYEALLERLWNAVYQQRASSGVHAMEKRTFQRDSKGWLQLGFQRKNPDSDFRGGGRLALKCLVYVLEAYPHEMLAIVQNQRPSTEKKTWYPFCVAGINLVCLLASVLKLGNGMFQVKDENYWGLFEDPSAFYELFHVTFIKMDAVATKLNASFMEFQAVLKFTRMIVLFMLQRAPSSVQELQEIAAKTSVDQFLRSMSKSLLEDTENGECPDPFSTLEDEGEIIIAAPSPRKKKSMDKSDTVSPTESQATCKPSVPETVVDVELKPMSKSIM